jgi:hypothetical protein
MFRDKSTTSQVHPDLWVCIAQRAARKVIATILGVYAVAPTAPVPALSVIEAVGGKMSSTSNPAAAVLGGLSACRSWQEDLCRDIHQHPELSHQEHRTAKLVAEMLRGSGYEVREGIGGTGVVGVMRNGSGPTVLMRADMDALPLVHR